MAINSAKQKEITRINMLLLESLSKQLNIFGNAHYTIHSLSGLVLDEKSDTNQIKFVNLCTVRLQPRASYFSGIQRQEEKPFFNQFICLQTIFTLKISNVITNSSYMKEHTKALEEIAGMKIKHKQISK